MGKPDQTESVLKVIDLLDENIELSKRMADLRDKALTVQEKIKKDELKKIAEKAEAEMIDDEVERLRTQLREKTIKNQMLRYICGIDDGTKPINPNESDADFRKAVGGAVDFDCH